ncbi:ACL067Cp [Eremothecium gossypii ATCC 10895]|uniref:Golgi SNAP receptor complex member 1 n=1 Tax=Eremothecium gossypii (strain ATCC 10895 / CBS 109.51 / FGSC 9923 / NRRL Y-1056) TaxID=284811 RepID=Q75CI6_EREGS|nr:ACL067Cp [Eremothecium gossypii ATCC 10895]AAS51161.2 ACL067Cp [Eremothecium gossypii ATCC 10895]AEY95452.1 FACL067Cp [Eremothecium gossypii FDAG1]
MASFVTVRGKAISLESQCDSLLSRYSSYAQSTSSEADSKERGLAEKLESVLKERQGVIEELQRICDDTTSIGSSKLSQLQRHREVLQQHWQTFQSIRSSIQQERSRLNLLFSVKRTLEQSELEEQPQEEQYAAAETRRIEESHNVLDRLISQAFETRDRFAEQRFSLQRANDRVYQTLQRIPGINHVLSQITIRRRKNAMILALTMTICIVLLYWNMVG